MLVGLETLQQWIWRRLQAPSDVHVQQLATVGEENRTAENRLTLLALRKRVAQESSRPPRSATFAASVARAFSFI
jgi:hypothetical protein